MTKIACIGEAMIELAMTQGAGRDSAAVGVAGDTLNTAIYMHRSAPDIQVDYITRVGDDPFSDKIRTFIAANGVGTQRIGRVRNASPGLYAITTNEYGERAFTYWRNASPARTLFAGGDFSALDGYDALYISGITMAILPHAVRLQLIQWLHDSNTVLIYDSNYRPNLWDSRSNAQMVTRAMWARADVALPSIDDEMLLFGEEAHQTEARFAAFQGRGALKRGAEGPMSLGEPVTQTYSPASDVIDTTAAGDSFNGAYVAAVLAGASQAEALMRAHEMAALVVQHSGAIVPL